MCVCLGWGARPAAGIRTTLELLRCTALDHLAVSRSLVPSSSSSSRAHLLAQTVDVADGDDAHHHVVSIHHRQPRHFVQLGGGRGQRLLGGCAAQRARGHQVLHCSGWGGWQGDKERVRCGWRHIPQSWRRRLAATGGGGDGRAGHPHRPTPCNLPLPKGSSLGRNSVLTPSGAAADACTTRRWAATPCDRATRSSLLGAGLPLRGRGAASEHVARQPTLRDAAMF
jgi:hypothetical protein